MAHVRCRQRCAQLRNYSICLTRRGPAAFRRRALVRPSQRRFAFDNLQAELVLAVEWAQIQAHESSVEHVDVSGWAA